MNSLLLCARPVNSPLFWRMLRFPAACSALVSGKPKWLVMAGYAAERAGKLVAAANLYKKAADAARVSERRESLRWMHAAEFFYQRALRNMGRSRVHDPLFECSIVDPAVPAQPGTSGVYKAEFVFSGLQIAGILPAASGSSLDIFLDNVKIRRINTVPGRFFRRFSFRFTRAALRAFPRSSLCTIKTEEGVPLAAMSGKASVRLSIPHGILHSHDSKDPLMSGERHIDKKGSLEPTFAELQEKRKAYIDAYNKAREFFYRRFNKELFLIYGTLLGFIREGSFIPGDDDFDLGFMADAGDPEGVKRETISMILELVKAGFNVSFNRRGRLFRLHTGDGPHLDIHSFWEQDGKIWAHNDFCAPGYREQYVPALEQNFDEFELKAFVPADPEAFLLAHYGPGWKTPDPGFVNYYAGKNKHVLSNLGKALITPKEYRQSMEKLNKLENEIIKEKGEQDNSSFGKFVSLAAQPLYPLPERDEELE